MIARTRFINPWQRGHFGPRDPIDQGVDARSTELFCVAAISICVIARQIKEALCGCHRIKPLLAWLWRPQGRGISHHDRIVDAHKKLNNELQGTCEEYQGSGSTVFGELKDMIGEIKKEKVEILEQFKQIRLDMEETQDKKDDDSVWSVDGEIVSVDEPIIPPPPADA